MSYLRLALSALLLLALAACGQRQTPAEEPTQTPTGDFLVDVGLYGDGFTANRAAAFADAATRWEQVVVGDLRDVAWTIPEGSCDPVDENGNKIPKFAGSDPGYTGVIDDIRIQASIKDIDGVGSTLGFASACILRQSTMTVVYGLMVFDTADVDMLEADGTFGDVILHEMGHVLGIGGLWNHFGFLNFNAATCLESDRVVYVGPNGGYSYQTFGGSGDVPVENNKQAGTACAHWDEDTFDHELMTGFAEQGKASPLSEITIGALDDLGYEVNYGAADDYTMPPDLLSVSPSSVRRPHAEFFGPLPPGEGFTPLE